MIYVAAYFAIGLLVTLGFLLGVRRGPQPKPPQAIRKDRWSVRMNQLQRRRQQ